MTIEVLEAVWNGALECSGTAPGLSGYQGRSSLYHSPTLERWEALQRGEVEQIQQRRGRPRVERVPVVRATTYRKHPALTPERAAVVLELLRKGVSYSGVAQAAGVTRDQARHVGKRHGISRARQ